MEHLMFTFLEGSKPALSLAEGQPKCAALVEMPGEYGTQ